MKLKYIFCFRLLLRLPPLRALEPQVLEELFFAGLIGQVQIDSVIPYILRMGSSQGMATTNIFLYCLIVSNFIFKYSGTCGRQVKVEQTEEYICKWQKLIKDCMLLAYKKLKIKVS